MSFMKWNAGVVAMASAAILLSGVLPSAHARVESSAGSDEIFLALRDAAQRDDGATTTELAARLADYTIPSYVEYYRLKPRIKDAPAAEIRDFLLRHDGSAIADRLRNDWLLELGRARDWAAFDEQYPQFVLDDDTQLKCYALMSKAIKGEHVADDARVVLAASRDYGEACPALIATLTQIGQFNIDDLWSHIRLAAESSSSATVRRLAALIEAADPVAQAIDKPGAVLARRVGIGRAAHEIFIIALGQLARTSPEQAGNALAGATNRLTLHQQALGWAQIAHQASLKLMPDAVDYWRKAGKVPLSMEAYQWRVRAALRAGDWKLVKSSIEAMPTALQGEPAWVYWLGRALRALDQPEAAQERFNAIADQTNFYGQLALEELGQQISIPPHALPPTPEEIAPMAANPGFRRALKLLELNLRPEGYREWNWQLRKMNDRQLLAAAEFARQSNSLDRMVHTSDRTRLEVDFTQRFPSPFHDVMEATTQALGMDKAWVYGLIRQESRFILSARSNVGASGLMQLMPATARYVANKIGMGNFSHGQVNDVGTNIVLGANYLSMVLNNLDGSQALATAAYNAGPGRPRAWRSTLTRTVEGAVFIESIPFSETRRYVKSVMSNATYYAALFENRPQSLKLRLGTVTPKGLEPTDLP
jgi:soluble lytic murein transglycosylase